MANVIDYEKKVSTSYTQDGFVVTIKRDPQRGGISKIENKREMTVAELKAHIKIRQDLNKKPWVSKSAIERIFKNEN